MRLTIGVAGCLQLCLQFLAYSIQAQEIRCTDSKFTITVDNGYELYIDGAQVTSGLPNANDWTAADTVPVPASARVIAIKAVDTGVVAGILASGAAATTDDSWKCTSTFVKGWTSVDFDDSDWPNAIVIGNHGISPWGNIAGISSDAKWIWTPYHVYGPTSDKTVYCRKRRGSPFTVTVDNQYELYIDGAQVTSGLPNANDWTVADTAWVPASARVIAIKGVDLGVVAGILASGAKATTDDSWKCTSTLVKGWTAVVFDDSTWPKATVIGNHGVSPWRTIAGISSDAKWIWTPNHVYGPTSDKTVYCRKRRDCSKELVQLESHHEKDSRTELTIVQNTTNVRDIVLPKILSGTLD